MPKPFIYFFISMLLPLFAESQQFTLKGIIVNGQTGEPVENVNLLIRNSTQGTSTNNDGVFELFIIKLPVEIEISCMGFEPISIEIAKPVEIPVEITLQPAIRNLEGVTITDKKAIPVYENPDYSVLDYEIMNDNLLVLVYKYQLKRSLLVLLTRTGDTLTKAYLPESPPGRLYKDPLGFVHYFSKKGNAYQCHFDKSLNTISFPYVYPTDTILYSFADFQFLMNNRIYFQENSPDGFSTLLGFYDKANGKKYLHASGDLILAKDYFNDIDYFLSPRRPDDTSSYLRGFQMRAFELFYKPKSIARMVKIGNNTIAIFDFTTDTLQIRTADWQLLSTTGFSFHEVEKENFLTSVASAYSGDKWKWKWNILTDEYSGAVYTCFERRGREKLCKIDLLTGKLEAEFELPVIFATKINIYKGEAFFMYKKIGEREKWRLYKMHL